MTEPRDIAGQDLGVAFGPGCQPSASAASADAPASSQSGIPNAGDDALSALAWCIEQAEGIMSISAGCATTHGDPGGGLEMVNSIASDIAINLEMLAQAIEARRAATGTGAVEDESAVGNADAPNPPSLLQEPPHE